MDPNTTPSSSRQSMRRTSACHRSTCQYCSTFPTSRGCGWRRYGTSGGQRRVPSYLEQLNQEPKWSYCSFDRTRGCCPGIGRLGCFGRGGCRGGRWWSAARSSPDKYSTHPHKSPAPRYSSKLAGKSCQVQYRCSLSDGARWTS